MIDPRTGTGQLVVVADTHRFDGVIVIGAGDHRWSHALIGEGLGSSA
jgi:hypothetical protein